MFIRAPKELALFVINERKKRKLSQAAIGDLVGLKQQTISAFEKKPESTKLDTLFRILSAVNVDMNLFSKNNTQKSKWKQVW